MTLQKHLVNALKKIFDYTVLFAPITMTIIFTLYVFINYSAKPFNNGFIKNYFSDNLLLYIILCCAISFAFYIKRKIFAATLYIVLLLTQISTFNGFWQQSLSKHPTMAPIFEFWAYGICGILLGITLEWFVFIRKDMKKVMLNKNKN